MVIDGRHRSLKAKKEGQQTIDAYVPIDSPLLKSSIRFQPDSASPNILNGSDGSRIIKSTSGKYRVYLATGALAGVKDSLESAQKLVQAKSNK